MKRIGISIILFVLLVFSMSCTGDLDSVIYRVRGTVVDTDGHGLEGIEVTFSGNFVSVKTESDGTWSKGRLQGEVRVSPIQENVVFSPSEERVYGQSEDLHFTATLPLVKEVESVETIHACYGTSFSDLGLPDEVSVRLEGQGSVQMRVDWDPSTYDATSLGRHTIEGDLLLPKYHKNPTGKVAEVEVLLSAVDIERIDALENIAVGYGTSLDEIGLPERVTAVLASTTTERVQVDWDTGQPHYEGTSPREYEFTGDLILPDYITNTKDLRATVRVRVLVGLQEVPPLEDMQVSYGTPYEGISFPQEVLVELEDGSTDLLEVSWDHGDPFYDGSSVGAYLFTGDLLLTEFMSNPLDLQAHVVVVVDSFQISGSVLEDGVGVEDVIISFEEGFASVETDIDGRWTKSELGGTVTVVPSKSGYSFYPPSIVVEGERDDVDFIASTMRAVVSVNIISFGPLYIFSVTVHSVESLEDGAGFTILEEENDFTSFGEEIVASTFLEDSMPLFMPLFILHEEGEVLAYAELQAEDLEEETIDLFPY